MRLVLKTQSGTLGHLQFSPEMGRIEVIDEAYSVDQMKELLEEADCFVFPSRGEGFGIPPLEAMATGLPTIIADNTGMSDYANNKYNYVIRKHEVVPAVRYPKPCGDVGTWHDPDYQELKALMKEVYENREAAAEKGKLASQWVRDEWNYDVAARKIIEAVEKHYV